MANTIFGTNKDNVLVGTIGSDIFRGLRGADIAIGNGGQRLTVQPKVGFVVTTFTGRYNDPDAWKLPIDVLVNHAIPAVSARANP